MIFRSSALKAPASAFVEGYDGVYAVEGLPTPHSVEPPGKIPTPPLKASRYECSLLFCGFHFVLESRRFKATDFYVKVTTYRPSMCFLL